MGAAGADRDATEPTSTDGAPTSPRGHPCRVYGPTDAVDLVLRGSQGGASGAGDQPVSRQCYNHHLMVHMEVRKILGKNGSEVFGRLGTKEVHR